MTTKIAVISDTHCHEWEEVHPKMRDIVAECDIAIHCGDIVRQPVVDGFLKSAQKGIIVHGNSDPVDLRETLPYIEVIEVEQVKIGITHPAWGGPEFPPSELFKDFDEELDIILFGHTHEPLKEDISGITESFLAALKKESSGAVGERRMSIHFFNIILLIL